MKKTKPSLALASKLKALEKTRKKWNDEEYGHIENWRRLPLNELGGLE